MEPGDYGQPCDEPACRGTDPIRCLSVYDLYLHLIPQYDHERISTLSKRLIDGITSQVEHVYRNGDSEGYAGCVNLSFAYIEGESFLMSMKVGG